MVGAFDAVGDQLTVGATESERLADGAGERGAAKASASGTLLLDDDKSANRMRNPTTIPITTTRLRIRYTRTCRRELLLPLAGPVLLDDSAGAGESAAVVVALSVGCRGAFSCF